MLVQVSRGSEVTTVHESMLKVEHKLRVSSFEDGQIWKVGWECKIANFQGSICIPDVK